uniref:Uncharacterized protein n=1 Tax=Cacopsylla melanoneura TaxID=428564 RepID=A0A8D9E925_9HEMI
MHVRGSSYNRLGKTLSSRSLLYYIRYSCLERCPVQYYTVSQGCTMDDPRVSGTIKISLHYPVLYEIKLEHYSGPRLESDITPFNFFRENFKRGAIAKTCAT